MVSKNHRTRRAATSVLLGTLAVLLGTLGASAMSSQCQQINTDWPGKIVRDYAENIYDQLLEGETITYFAQTAISQIAGGTGMSLDVGYMPYAMVEGSQTEEKEISGSFRVAHDRQEVSVMAFANPDTSVFVRMTCEGPEPKIESITPSIVKASGTNQITINGLRLGGANSIMIGSYAANGIWSVSDESIVLDVPPQPVGTVDIIVRSPRGASRVSTASKLTFANEPGMPGIGTASGNGATASVSFSAPSSDGGAAILDYTVVATPGNLSATGTASPIEVNGLAAGTSYTFTVTARNAIGNSQASVASAPLLIKTAQSISFPPPSPMTFGSPTALAATASSGLAVTFTTSTPAICSVDASGNVTSLTTGNCEMIADQAGDATYDAAPSTARTLTIVPALPDPPVMTTVSAGNRSATASFNAPGFTGGANISGYRVTADPGGAFAEGTASPLTITGLTNGLRYTFTATATTMAGTSAPSAATGQVMPQSPQSITLSDPGTVQIGASVTIIGTASSGLPVVFNSINDTICTIDASGVVTLISPGTCSIAANQPGNAEFVSAPRVTRSFMVNGSVPSAPSSVSALAAPGQASVSFTPPSFTGGTPISFYTVHVTPGGQTVTGNASPILVTGLSNGTSYSFAVTATNGTGPSALSLTSPGVTPKALQTIALSDPGLVQFGDNVTITASASSGLSVALSTTTPAVCSVDVSGAVSLLAPGTCIVTGDQAGNTFFEAAPQVSVSFLIGSVAPGAPTHVTALAGQGQAEISFTPPSFTGGSPITSYTVVASPDGNMASGSSSPIIVTGLRNGTSYSFVVTATNAVGPGANSMPSNNATPQGAQTINLLNPGPQVVGATLAMSGSASSGLPLSFASNSPGICTATPEGQVTTLAAGQCVISASHTGDATYLPAVPVTETFSVSLTQVSITPPAGQLTPAMVGEAYTHQLSASGQTGALQWSLTSGPLPAGLVLDTTMGTISGTPSAVGSSTFTISVTDLSGGGSAMANYSINVSPREITAPSHTVVVPSGTVPAPLDLATGAMGGPFSGAAILAVEPAIAGSASIAAGASVTLDFKPNPKFSGQAVVWYTLTSALGTSAPFSVTYLITADLARVQAELTQQRDQFVQSRSAVWAASVSVPTFHDRQSAMTASTPGSISVSPSNGNSVTLAYAASSQPAALSAAESLAMVEPDASGLRFWIDGTNTVHVRSGNAGEQWGHGATLSLGADMLATEKILLGVSVHVDWMNAQRGDEKNTGTGLAAGPYVSIELAENLYLDASMLYGQSWNDTTDGIFAATFGTTRFLTRAGLQGRVSIADDLILIPSVSLFYLREEAGGYVATDKNGTLATIAPLLLEQLQASVGSTLRYRLVADNGWTIQPYLGFDLGSALSAGGLAYSASLSTGVDLQSEAGWTLGLSGRLLVQTGGTTAISAQTKLGMRF